MTTDPTPLQERIARALYENAEYYGPAPTRPPWDWRDDEERGEWMEIAAAVLPIIAAAREAVPALLDALAAAEARATRAEAQAAIRGRAVVIYRERAREAEADRDWNLRSSRQAKEERIKANARAAQAEARVRHLEDTARVLVREAIAAEDARDEHRRGKAAAEARIAEEKRLRMEATAVATRAEARIEAVRDVLDRSRDDITMHTYPEQLNADIRRALNGGQ